MRRSLLVYYMNEWVTEYTSDQRVNLESVLKVRLRLVCGLDYRLIGSFGE